MSIVKFAKFNSSLIFLRLQYLDVLDLGVPGIPLPPASSSHEARCSLKPEQGCQGFALNNSIQSCLQVFSQNPDFLAFLRMTRWVISESTGSLDTKSAERDASQEKEPILMLSGHHI